MRAQITLIKGSKDTTEALLFRVSLSCKTATCTPPALHTHLHPRTKKTLLLNFNRTPVIIVSVVMTIAHLTKFILNTAA